MSEPQLNPRQLRLTRSLDFRRAYNSGRKLRVSSAIIFLLKNTAGQSRLGVTVTRKVGNAVGRNRLKRQVREIFRRHGPSLKPGWDIVVNVKPEAARMAYSEIERDLLSAIGRVMR